MNEWLELYLEHYRAIRRDGLSLSELVQNHIPEQLRPALKDLGMIMLRPDAVLNGMGPYLLDYLETTYGIVPLALKIVVLTPDRFDVLYRLKIHFFADNIWLHHRVFEQAPCAVFLVAGAPGDAPSLCEHLDTIKGASTPIQGADWQLRTLGGRQSSFHAVIHTSEDPAALIYESTLFFSWQTIREALQVVHNHHETGVALPAIERSYRNLLLTYEPKEHLTVFAHLLLIKQKILAALLIDSPALPENQLKQLLDHTQSAFLQLQGRSYREQRDAFIRCVQAERTPLQELIQRAEEQLPRQLGAALAGAQRGYPGGTSQRWGAIDQTLATVLLLYSIWYLSGYEVYEQDSGTRLFEVLAQHNVPLSPWQQTLVLSGLRGDINLSAHWGNDQLFPLA